MSFLRAYESILKPPLFESTKANLLEFYDDNGKLIALLFKQFNNDLYMLVTKADPDWHATLVRLGYVNVKLSPQEFLKSLNSK